MRSNPVGKAFRALWGMKKGVPLTLHLMKDSRMGRQYKILFVLVTMGYLFFPYDFIFDFPIFGQLDDLAILLYMVNWFIQRAPKAVLEEYGWHDGESVGKKPKEKKAKKQAPAQVKTASMKRKKENDGDDKSAGVKIQRRLHPRHAAR